MPSLSPANRTSRDVSFGLTQNALQLWPVVSFINYTYVPLRLRVLVVNVVALFW